MICQQTEHAHSTKYEVCCKSITNAVCVFDEDRNDANNNANEEHDTDGSANRVGEASLVSREDTTHHEQRNNKE